MSKARGLADLGNAYSDGALSNRNLIINGAMQVAQRGTSYTYGSGNSLYTTVDRFKQAYFGTWASNHSEITQETDAPDGFLNSLKVKALVAQDYSSALGSWVQYSFENQDTTSLQNGSGMKDFTASLWLKSNKTGNVTVSVEGEDYSYSTYVTINSANTWEYKTVTFPATTLGVGIDYAGDPTGSDFNLKVGLGTDGSWLVDTDDQWNDKTSNRGVLSFQQTNFQAAVNDYLQITGVQLEIGDTATPFEHRSYGDELARCQRYYYRLPPNTETVFASLFNARHVCRVPFPTTMRANPTASTPTWNTGRYGGGSFLSGATLTINTTFPTTDGYGWDVSSSTSPLRDQSGAMELTTATTFDAEL
jgi:hypothetical protein